MSPVDLRFSIVKPFRVQWMIILYDYFKSKPDIIKISFTGACISKYLISIHLLVLLTP